MRVMALLKFDHNQKRIEHVKNSDTVPDCQKRALPFFDKEIAVCRAHALPACGRQTLRGFLDTPKQRYCSKIVYISGA